MSRLRAEIAARGFEVDPLVTAPVPSWGLNLACGWPLPVDPSAYQQLAGELAALEPGLAVYPHAQTHITLLTLVSFKEHLDPVPEERQALEALIPPVNAVVSEVARPIAPFVLEIGAPVLSPRAIFFPLADPSGAVARFRAAVSPAVRACSPRFTGCQPPQVVHATLARFRAPPAPGFADRFERWARHRTLGRIRIHSILATTETRPYMRDGQVVGRFVLGGP